MNQVNKVTLYPKGEDAPAEQVNVTEGGADEAYWRDRGYVAADELASGDELEKMTVPELEQFVANSELDVDLSDHRLKADKLAAVRDALAARDEAEG